MCTFACGTHDLEFKYVESNGRMIHERITGNDLERNSPNLIELLFRHLSDVLKKTKKNHSQDSRYPDLDSKRITTEYKPEMLLSRVIIRLEFIFPTDAELYYECE